MRVCLPSASIVERGARTCREAVIPAVGHFVYSYRHPALSSFVLRLGVRQSCVAASVTSYNRGRYTPRHFALHPTRGLVFVAWAWQVTAREPTVVSKSVGQGVVLLPRFPTAQRGL